MAITLGARAIAVSLSTRAVPRGKPPVPGALGVLRWGGLRGGISIALALWLPAGPTRDLLLAATFAAVLFSVLVQRAALGRMIERGKVRRGEDSPPETIHWAVAWSSGAAASA